MKAKSKAEAEQAPPEQPPEVLSVAIRLGQELFAVAVNNKNENRPSKSVNQLIALHDGIAIGPSNCMDISLNNLPKVLEVDGYISKLCVQEDVDLMWTLLIKLRKQIMERTMCPQDCINIARYIIPAQL